MSKILIIAATGFVGKQIAKASVALGHPTSVLVRESTAKDPNKAQLLEEFKASGISLIPGSIDDHDSLVNAIKDVDVVISAVGSNQILEQTKIIKAIKEAGNVKRFVPSEFGVDVDKVKAVEPANTLFASKSKIRREIEASDIPYTIVCPNFIARYFLPSLGQYGPTAPPTDKVAIMGDGDAKVVYVYEEDVGIYTIKAVDDPRTVNKILHMRPPANTISTNELVALWEKKTGKTLEKIHLSEEEVFKLIAESPFPVNERIGIRHVAYLRGDQTNFEIGSNGVEASQLYPEVKHVTVDEMLDRLVQLV